jgi:hypothetical protein
VLLRKFKLLGPRVIVFEVLHGKKRDITGIFIFRRFSNLFGLKISDKNIFGKR